MFTDAAHGLTATIRFGSVEGAASELLRRPDALSGEVVREVHLPKSASSPGGLDHASLAAKRRPASSSFAGLVRSSMTLGLAGKGSRQGKGTPVLERNGSVVVDTIVLATCSGNWLSHLDWGGERRWTLAEDAPEEWDPLPAPLPSDARYREDLAALAAGDLLLAQRAKEALEQRQRADAKLRKEGHAAATKS